MFASLRAAAKIRKEAARELFEERVEEDRNKLRRAQNKMFSKCCPLRPGLDFCYKDCSHFYEGVVRVSEFSGSPIIFYDSPVCRLWRK